RPDVEVTQVGQEQAQAVGDGQGHAAVGEDVGDLLPIRGGRRADVLVDVGLVQVADRAEIDVLLGGDDALDRPRDAQLRPRTVVADVVTPVVADQPSGDDGRRVPDAPD